MSNTSEPKIHAIAKYWAQRLATIGIKKIDINVDGDITITYGDNTTSIISGSIFMEKKNYDPTNYNANLIIYVKDELVETYETDTVSWGANYFKRYYPLSSYNE